MPTWLRSAVVFGLIYMFLVGVSALEKGIKIMGEDTQQRLFSSVDNPIAGLCVGILGTVLVQSSSASTSVIVGLVATKGISVDAAIPMIVGANIGTTVTNTLVSLGHIRQSGEFKRAFATATVHDFFNVMAVGLLLPVELATGIISNTARVEKSVNTVLAEGSGSIAMLLGLVITVAVQSSHDLVHHRPPRRCRPPPMTRHLGTAHRVRTNTGARQSW